MRIVTKINDINELELLSKYSDHIMLPYELISKENINKMLNLNIKPILMFNLMVHSKEVETLSIELLKYKDLDVLYYITDLGLARVLKANELINKTIYDPITMITNSLDAKNYYDYGFDSIGLSNEITVADLKKIISKTGISTFYQVFGYRLMLHSRRKLVSLYTEKIDRKIDMKNMRLVESTRKDSYPIVENEYGTFIYRSYLISLLSLIKELDLKYAYFESFRLNIKDYISVLDIFKKYINEEYTLNQALEHISLLNLDIKDGFTYQDSIYNKEEF